MVSFLVNVMFVVTVLGQAPDPTKVCLPDVFQTSVFWLDTHSVGVLAYDFPNEVLAIRSSNGLRSVYNLSDYSAVAINETDGSCEELPRDVRYQTIGFQCLPATAVLISNATRHVGLINSNNQFLGWKVHFPGVGTVIAAFTTTTPTIPIIREFRIPGADSQPEIVFFFNPKLSVDDKKIFSVPDVCTPVMTCG